MNTISIILLLIIILLLELLRRSYKSKRHEFENPTSIQTIYHENQEYEVDILQCDLTIPKNQNFDMHKRHQIYRVFAELADKKGAIETFEDIDRPDTIDKRISFRCRVLIPNTTISYEKEFCFDCERGTYVTYHKNGERFCSVCGLKHI